MSNKLFQPWLVCYDIEDNKTRRRLFDALKDLGMIALQESVFWGNLNQAELRAMQREAHELLDKKTDKIFWISADLQDRLQKQGIGYQYFTLPVPDGHDVL